MKIKTTFVSLATIVLVLAGGLPLTAVADHTFQAANMVRFSDGGLVKGAATLTRTENSATARIYTSQLRINAVYSLWWIVWNDPTLCASGPGGCGLGDLGISGNVLFSAGAFVTGEDRTANASVHMEAGDLGEGIQVLIDQTGGVGLDLGNGYDAEIHLIVRHHGPIIRGMADLQITLDGGGCDIRNCFNHQTVAFPGNPPSP